MFIVKSSLDVEAPMQSKNMCFPYFIVCSPFSFQRTQWRDCWKLNINWSQIAMCTKRHLSTNLVAKYMFTSFSFSLLLIINEKTDWACFLGANNSQCNWDHYGPPQLLHQVSERLQHHNNHYSRDFFFSNHHIWPLRYR